MSTPRWSPPSVGRTNTSLGRGKWGAMKGIWSEDASTAAEATISRSVRAGDFDPGGCAGLCIPPSRGAGPIFVLGVRPTLRVASGLANKTGVADLHAVSHFAPAWKASWKNLVEKRRRIFTRIDLLGTRSIFCAQRTSAGSYDGDNDLGETFRQLSFSAI